MREAELERQRQAEGRERLRNLNTIQEEILQLNQLLDPSTQTKTDVPLASLSTLSTRGNQLCSQVSEVVRKTAEVSLTANFLKFRFGSGLLPSLTGRKAEAENGEF